MSGSTRRVSEAGGEATDGSRPVPAPPPNAAALPQAVTFFLTGAQRRAVLRALRRLDPDRTRALCRALGIEHSNDADRQSLLRATGAGSAG